MGSSSVKTSLLLVVVALSMLFAFTVAYQTGAPVSACGTAKPGHVNVTQDTSTPIDPADNANSPYSFTVEGSEYNPGGELEVSITIASGTDNFQGFLLQARKVDDSTVVGTFTEPDSDIGQLLTCTNAGDTVTHTNNTEKTEQSFTWHAPSDLTGNITFFGTVALDHDTFYVGLESDELTEGAAVTQGPTTTGATEMTTADVTNTTTTEMTTADAVKLSTGFGILLLAAVVSVLQLFA
ncbi:putative defense protein 3 isoform X2 [Lytechinus variegatus]|uniref:putative defense protein 3 isoform X2 n=1 Tax=Lytechinus variegatus TaxID=7654 RepID=UPI001BB2BEEF|nr:putative defense protein 3 isoform X2 [Lytechinus variegatus]